MLYATVLSYVMRDLGMTKSTTGPFNTLTLVASGEEGRASVHRVVAANSERLTDSQPVNVARDQEFPAHRRHTIPLRQLPDCPLLGNDHTELILVTTEE
jgi:hypothetical protein